MKLKKEHCLGHDFDVFTSERARFLWPKLLAKFLESLVTWNFPPRQVRFAIDQHETDNPDGEPVGISCEYLFSNDEQVCDRFPNVKHLLFHRLHETQWITEILDGLAK